VTAAARVAWSLRSTLLLSMAIGLGAVWLGLTLAYYGDLAPGGAIVLVAAGAFAAAALGATVKSQLGTG
jgi:zinc transport system permease protein